VLAEGSDGAGVSEMLGRSHSHETQEIHVKNPTIDKSLEPFPFHSCVRSALDVQRQTAAGSGHSVSGRRKAQMGIQLLIQT